VSVWNKTRDDWTATQGPFALRVSPKGDGRWNWQIVRDNKPNPEATGVASSLGAAKTAAEQFVKRSGLV
jgi:hypothetical protein